MNSDHRSANILMFAINILLFLGVITVNALANVTALLVKSSGRSWLSWCCCGTNA